MTWTVETLAREPRWDRAKVLALPGRARGDTLGAWGDNLVARFGAPALARVRTRVGPPHDQLAAALTKRDWVPVHAQLLVTEAIVDELLAGDWTALYPLILEDTKRGLGRITCGVVRALGPDRALRSIPSSFRDVHDHGTLTLDGNRLVFAGSPLFTHPTWRILQLLATRLILDLAGQHAVVVGHDSPEGFVAERI